MFCSAKAEKAQQLETAKATEDFKNYIIYIHALKSTSLSIGGKRVSQLAARLEKAGKAGDYAYIKENHAEAMSAYDETVKAAEAYLQLQNPS